MATMQDVAKKAGVSTTTVSHVINNTRFTSDEVRTRVLDAMRELGYRPNTLARSLRRGETMTVGLILPDSANPFFAEISRAIEETAFERGYNVILCNSEGDLQKEARYTEVLCNKQVDGMLFVAAGDHPDSVRGVLARNLPLVVVDREIHAEGSFDTVLVDNRRGGYLAAEHLIRKGRRKIACIAGPSDIHPSALRLTGYQDALRVAGLPENPDWILSGDFHPESGYQAMKRLYGLPNRPDAVVACSDMMAIGVLRAAAELNWKVPGDVAVVGFDNIELAGFTVPPLTTVNQPKPEMGRCAMDLLLERIEKPSLASRRVELPLGLVFRESA